MERQAQVLPYITTPCKLWVQVQPGRTIHRQVPLAGSRGAGEYSLGPVSVEPHGRSPARSAPAFLPEESVPLPKLPRHQNTRMSESSLLFTSW